MTDRWGIPVLHIEARDSDNERNLCPGCGRRLPGSRFSRVPDEGSHSQAQLVAPALVSGNYFDVLGVLPAVGRLLTPADNIAEDTHPWAVLGYDFWRSRFAGDPRVVGRRITLNGSPFTIVGVTRSGFTGTQIGSRPDVYLPIMELRQVRRRIRRGTAVISGGSMCWRG